MTDNPGDDARADRLLRPEFVAGLEQLDDDELLTARDEAVDEENQISYVRRLLQGRLDLLRFEKERRSGGSAGENVLASAHDDRELARALGKVLTAPPTGELPVIRPDQSRSERYGSVSAHRQAAEGAAGDVRLSDPATLDDDALDEALERVAVFEAEVSVNRRRLQRVADTVVAEVGRRVEAGRLPADELPAAKHGDPHRAL